MFFIYIIYQLDLFVLLSYHMTILLIQYILLQLYYFYNSLINAQSQLSLIQLMHKLQYIMFCFIISFILYNFSFFFF